MEQLSDLTAEARKERNPQDEADDECQGADPEGKSDVPRAWRPVRKRRLLREPSAEPLLRRGFRIERHAFMAKAAKVVRPYSERLRSPISHSLVGQMVG